MIVQTEAARELLDVDPSRAFPAIEQIERTGRETLRRMRDILSVLRANEAPDRVPHGLDGAVA